MQAVFTRDGSEGSALTAPDEPLHGAQLCASVAELVAACQVPCLTFDSRSAPTSLHHRAIDSIVVPQILVVCLPYEAASLDVLLEQALPHSQPDQLFIDTSTVSQETSLRRGCPCDMPLERHVLQSGEHA